MGHEDCFSVAVDFLYRLKQLLGIQISRMPNNYWYEQLDLCQQLLHLLVDVLTSKAKLLVEHLVGS